METDYINREADGDDFVRRADIVEKFMDRLPSISVGYLCKIADEIPHADVRSVKWIPVTERLPEEGRLVLAAFDDVVLVAFYGNYSWHDAGTFSVFYPTHWMPLPEPPKEG